jgi:hypothetical protein
MADTPPDWVLIEAAKRCGLSNHLDFLRDFYLDNRMFRALCDMILKHEQPPVDRKLLCAREAMKNKGFVPDGSVVQGAINAIDLYLEGFGK